MNKLIVFGAILLLLFGCTQQPITQLFTGGGAGSGNPSQFGNNTTTTCYIGGTVGILNCTGQLIGKNLTLNTSCSAGQHLTSTSGVVGCTADTAETDPIYTAQNSTIIRDTNTSWVATTMGNTTILRTMASGACTYGVANFTLTSPTTASVTCAAQQGTSSLTIAQVDAAMNNFTANQSILGTSALIMNNSNFAIWYNGTCMVIGNSSGGINIC